MSVEGERLPAPVDLGDALAVVGYAADAVDAGLDARIAAALDPADTTALVAALDDLRRALQAGDARAVRRGFGLFARLAGHDVLAEAEATRLRDRSAVLLLDADRAAARVADGATWQQVLHDDLSAALAALAARIADARGWLAAHSDAGLDGGNDPATSPRARFERRLHQLDTVHHAWTLAAAQLAMVRDQRLELLARHRRIRDVLVPAWRQQALAGAARDGARLGGDAAAAQAAIAAEVDAMTATLDRGARRPLPSGDDR